MFVVLNQMRRHVRMMEQSRSKEMTITEDDGRTVYAKAEEALKHKTFIAMDGTTEGEPLTISTEVDPDFADEDEVGGEVPPDPDDYVEDEDYKAELSEE